MPKNEKDKKTAGTKIDAVNVELPTEGKEYKATVTQIEVTKAGEIFGDKAKEPDKDVVRISFEGPEGVAGNATISAPGISKGKVIARNPKSNLFKYVKHYGHGPRKGDAVIVRMDEDGFFRLIVE